MKKIYRFDPYTGDPIGEPEIIEEEKDKSPKKKPAYVAYREAREAKKNAESEKNVQPDYKNAQAQSQPNNQEVYQTTEQVNPQPINQSTSQHNSPTDDSKANHKAKNLSTASLIVGICSIVFSTLSCCFVPFISWICSTVGIVLSAKAKDSTGKRSKIAIAGFITSIVGIVLSLIMLSAFIIRMPSNSPIGGNHSNNHFKFHFNNNGQEKDFEFGNDDDSPF